MYICNNHPVILLQNATQPSEEEKEGEETQDPWEGGKWSSVQAEITQLKQQVENLTQQLQEKEQAMQHKERQFRSQIEGKEELIALLEKQIENLRSQLFSLQPQRAEFWEVPRKDVTLNTKVLSTGWWGFVAEGAFQGQTVAIKSLQVVNLEMTPATIHQEIGIMAQLRHPNLVLLIAAVIDEQDNPLLITEFLDTSLQDVYQRGRLDRSSKMDIFHDVACALNYLHLHLCGPITHGDVSSANVLLEAKPYKQWKAKLSDFVAAKLVEKPKEALVYTAPEVRTKNSVQSQTSKVDVYSFGILLCEVTIGQFPTDNKLPRMIQAAGERWPSIQSVITTCTKEQPDQRPTIAAVLEDLDRMQ